ncbi:hypothetical protein EV127DRAFT_506104, partial [Xylaria flabelliformis]
YIGESIAPDAAVKLQPHYASELSISGTVVGRLGNSVAPDFDLFYKTPIAGDLVAVELHLTTQHPESCEYVHSCIKPDATDEL